MRTVKGAGGSLMIWGYISYQGVGKIVRVEGTMNTTKYLKMMEEEALPHMDEGGLNLS